MRLWLIVGDQIFYLDSDPLQSALVADDQVKEFEALFEREKERLFQALCLVTCNRFEAEELAQDAFLSVYERWDRVAKIDEPTGYLYRTAMNAFRSWPRRSSHPHVGRRLWHGPDGAVGFRRSREHGARCVSPMSPDRCHTCLRNDVNDVPRTFCHHVPGSHSVEFLAISGRSMGGGRWTLTELWEGGNRCA
jgi:hypothetical protein